MKKLGVALMLVLCLSIPAMAVIQDAAVHYTFTETAPGTWDVHVEVTGADTAGLSAYALWVAGSDPASVSYTENVLSAVTSTSPLTVWGFNSLVSSPPLVDGKFNVGDSQPALDKAILGIGKDPVFFDGMFDDVDLDVPALLGTLTTPTGLGEGDLYPGPAGTGLFNAAGDGYLASLPTPTYDLNPIPEPATLTLLGLAGFTVLIRRRQ